jgi:hypothetical protein
MTRPGQLRQSFDTVVLAWHCRAVNYPDRVLKKMRIGREVLSPSQFHTQ